ncbi:TonB-dependent receptor [Chryseobacterium sp. 3008163]|uniref:TonB-dependent receptor domain-containing protein n=1 Tax=Chryseobacterium sp. 3008163 TaxID=2478663 RepID=UPI001E2C2AE6|nr:TonB-dependent receptor [Chryseobacterium sp. 3008163]
MLDILFTRATKIYGNISKVHRVPTFTDLYYTSKTEQGNENLLPESAVYAEIGYQYQNKNILGKVSGFYRGSSDAIDWVKNSLQDPIWYAKNVGDTEIKGIEAELSHQVFDWMKYTVGYTYLDNKFKEFNDSFSRYVLDNLKHQFISKLQFKIRKKITTELLTDIPKG